MPCQRKIMLANPSLRRQRGSAKIWDGIPSA
jgi:hypothetical protein